MTPPVPRYWREAETMLAANMTGYAPRSQQAELTAILHDTFTRRASVAVEAPTGSGKSFSTLVVAQNLPDRTVISTATRALQNQYKTKDIPFLSSAGILDDDEAVVIEGRNNYVCWNRVVAESKSAMNPAAKKIIRTLVDNVPDSVADGPLLRDELPISVPDWLWERIRSDGDACRATNCRRDNCPYLYSRQRSRTARIVIVNHHMLLADAAIKSCSAVAWGRRSPGPDDKENLAVLGPYRYLIVDEAHALESAAESFGERKVSIRGIQALATRVKKLPDSAAAVNHLGEAAAALAAAIADMPTESLLDPVDTGPVLLVAAGHARRARNAVREIGSDSIAHEVDAEVLAAACNSLAERLTEIDSAIRFGEDELGARAPSVREGAVISQLVDTGPWLRRYLWDQVSAALVSGTLTAPGRPSFVTDRVGMNGTPVHQLGQVFDLRKQRLVYITPRADSGGGARSGESDVLELLDLIDASSGRALVLFPAVQDLKYVYDRIHRKVSQRVLAQGVTPAADQPKSRARSSLTVPMSNGDLAREFHLDTDSVLLATRSFFEGVDFPGDTCSMVVIVRYPNLRPDDPLTLARRRIIERRGGSAWVEYQEPSMQMLFKQAAGRAVRRVDDRGVVAVLDPRSGSKQYARRALLGLAPSDFTDSLDDVKSFIG